MSCASPPDSLCATSGIRGSTAGGPTADLAPGRSRSCRSGASIVCPARSLIGGLLLLCLFRRPISSETGLSGQPHVIEPDRMGNAVLGPVRASNSGGVAGHSAGERRRAARALAWLNNHRAVLCHVQRASIRTSLRAGGAAGLAPASAAGNWDYARSAAEVRFQPCSPRVDAAARQAEALLRAGQPD